MKSITINGREYGPGRPAYIVAEMSANHGQKFDQAVALVRAAAATGANAIKLQTYTPDTLTIACDNEYFRISGGTLWDGRTLHELYGEAYTPWDWHPKLKAVAEEAGLDFFSTPFDATAVDFLESLQVPVHKVASFELVDLPLLRKIGRTGKPVIMSTGMAEQGRDRGSRPHPARCRQPATGAAEVHQRLPSPARRYEPAHDTRYDAGLWRPGGAVGPHPGHRGAGSGCRPRRLRY